MTEKAGDFTASVFVDQGEIRTRIADYHVQRSSSDKGVYCYQICEKIEHIREADRERLNQKLSERLKPVLLFLKEDFLREEK